MRTMVAALIMVLSPLIVPLLHAQPTASDLANSINNRFTVVGGAAPFTLMPNVGSIETAARLVHSDMMLLGYTQANPYVIDARGAVAPAVARPVIWQGCAAVAGLPNPSGVTLTMSANGVILLGTGFDGLAGSGDPGANAFVRALNCTGCTVYAVGGLPDNNGAPAAGGWAEAHDFSTGGGGAEAYGGDGINDGNGGYAISRSLGGSAAGHCLAEGGDSDTGDGGDATVGAFGAAVGGTGTATGGHNTAGGGNGGDAMVRSIGNAVSTGGNSPDQLGGDAQAGVNPLRIGGTGTAQGGSGGAGAGAGGTATVFSVGNATATGGIGDASLNGNGGAAAADSSNGTATATGARGWSGGAATSITQALAVSTAIGGAGAGPAGTVGGNATATTQSAVTGAATATAGSCPPATAGTGGTATATGGNGTDGPNGPTGPAGGVAISP